MKRMHDIQTKEGAVVIDGNPLPSGVKVYSHDVEISYGEGGSYFIYIISFNPSTINGLSMLMDATSCLNADTLKVYNDDNEYILSAFDNSGEIVLKVITSLFDENSPKFSLTHTGVDPADITSVQDTVVEL